MVPYQSSPSEHRFAFLRFCLRGGRVDRDGIGVSKIVSSRNLHFLSSDPRRGHRFSIRLQPRPSPIVTTIFPLTLDSSLSLTDILTKASFNELVY